MIGLTIVLTSPVPVISKVSFVTPIQLDPQLRSQFWLHTRQTSHGQALDLMHSSSICNRDSTRSELSTSMSSSIERTVSVAWCLTPFNYERNASILENKKSIFHTKKIREKRRRKDLNELEKIIFGLSVNED